MIRALLILLLSGCSTISYNRIASDGSTIHLSGWSIGTDSALSGLDYDVEKDGGVKFKIDGLNSDQTKMIESIISGAIKGLK